MLCPVEKAILRNPKAKEVTGNKLADEFSDRIWKRVRADYDATWWEQTQEAHITEELPHFTGVDLSEKLKRFFASKRQKHGNFG